MADAGARVFERRLVGLVMGWTFACLGAIGVLAANSFFSERAQRQQRLQEQACSERCERLQARRETAARDRMGRVYADLQAECGAYLSSWNGCQRRLEECEQPTAKPTVISKARRRHARR